VSGAELSASSAKPDDFYLGLSSTDFWWLGSSAPLISSASSASSTFVGARLGLIDVKLICIFASSCFFFSTPTAPSFELFRSAPAALPFSWATLSQEASHGLNSEKLD